MSAAANHPAAPLHPNAELRGATNFAHSVRLVQKAEAAKLDFVFQADATGAPDDNVVDRQAGLFTDPDQVHRLNHDGTCYTARGPLNAPRPLQGWPVIDTGSSLSLKGRNE